MLGLALLLLSTPAQAVDDWRLVGERGLPDGACCADALAIFGGSVYVGTHDTDGPLICQRSLSAPSDSSGSPSQSAGCPRPVEAAKLEPHAESQVPEIGPEIPSARLSQIHTE